MKRFDKDSGHLAKTRKEQFGFIIRNNTSSLFFSNFLMFAFSIPLIVSVMFCLITYKNTLAKPDVTSTQLFSIFLIGGLAVIPSIIIFGLGLSGLYSMIKQVVFESTTKVSTFFKGIKQNFKSFFFVNLIFGIVTGLLIINIGVYFYIDTFPAGVKLTIMIINILLLLTLLLGKGFNNFECVVFNNSTYAYLRNGIYLFYKSLPISLLIFLILILPVVLILFLPIQAVFVPLGILATFYFSFSALGIFLIGISTYERIIPKQQIKEIYHKGLEDINL